MMTNVCRVFNDKVGVELVERTGRSPHYVYQSLGCSKASVNRMVRYAKTQCVGKPFSNTGMARSLLWPRQTDGTSFFCAGFTTRLSSKRLHFLTTPIVFARRTGRRHLEGGRAARGEFESGQRHARDAAQDLPEPCGGDGQSVCIARPERHHGIDLLQHHGGGREPVPPAQQRRERGHHDWRHHGTGACRRARDATSAPIHHGARSASAPTGDHRQHARRAPARRLPTARALSRHHARWQRARGCRHRSCRHRSRRHRWRGGEHVHVQRRREQRANGTSRSCRGGGGIGKHWHERFAHGNAAHAE